mgnify:CR=1 FL=1
MDTNNNSYQNTVRQQFDTSSQQSGQMVYPPYQGTDASLQFASGAQPYYPGENDKKTGRKFFSRVGFSYFIFYIVTAILQIVVSDLVNAFAPDAAENYAISIIMALAPIYLIGAPVAYLVIKKLPAEKPAKNKWTALQLIGGFFVAYGLIYVSNIVGTSIGTVIESIFPDLRAATNDVQDLVFSGDMIVNVLAMVIIGPIMEELLFRKMLCDRVRVYGEGVCMVISGLIFAIFHGNLTQGVYAFTLGAFLAYVYLKTGKLLVPICYHMGINLMGSVLPLLAMKDLDLNEYMEAFGSGDTDTMMAFIESNVSALASFGIYISFVLFVAITGIVILIVTCVKKRVFINPGRYVIPKGQRFSTVILNVGMMLYIIFGIALVILAMFAG